MTPPSAASPTRHYVMIGAPVTSVRTPPLLDAFLAGEGVKAVIDVLHLEPGDLPDFMENAKADQTIDGLVVTMPHKKTILPHLQALATGAGRAGSANTVKRLPSGALAGAQFDGVGLVRAVLARGVALERARVLLAGVGGAGLAIAHAVAGHGCAALDLVDLDQSLLDHALDALAGSPAAPVSDRAGGPGDYDLLINATPLGMKADDPSPFDEALVASAGAVADIVADPNRTRLAAMVAKAGGHLITGREMVAAQIEPIGRWLLSDRLDEP